MSFDYQKLKAKNTEAEGSMWTSYSDLFMVLSVVFLLLYVVASLRSGTSSVQQAVENQKLKSEAEDLRRQIQAYNTLKEDYVAKEASQEEAKTYNELMDKLTLLQDEAKEEKKQLENKAQANAEKAEALNQYQQLVRNIINTNMLAKKRIKVRDDLIVKRNDTIKEMDSTITEQSKEISQKSSQIQNQENQIAQSQTELEQKRLEMAKLDQDVKAKEQILRQNREQITSLNDNLSQKIKDLQSTTAAGAEMNRKIAMMKLENAKKVNELQTQSKNMEASLQGMNQELAQASGQLKDAKEKISEQEAYKAKLEGEIKDAQEKYKGQVAKMEKDFQDKIAAERGALEKSLDAEKASAAEKAQKLAEFKAAADKERADLDKRLSELKGQVANAEKAAGEAHKALGDAKKDHDRYLASIDKLKKDNAGLAGDLGRAKEVVEAKKKLAEKIAKNLERNGIKAGVDPKNGDVTINFGDEYFDTGKSDLKDNMKNILKKFIPTYSKSLFDDKNVAKEILSVEIVGFSSPTYKGKYVDPQSLAETDRAAVAYNLDLSYDRAKSIFSYIFDKKTMTYDYQKELLPIVKVTGRSFLAEEVKGRTIASGLTHKEYCAQHNCEKSQKVIIRFNLKD